MLNLDNETIALDSTLSRVELEELFAMKAVLGNPDIVNNVCVFEKLCFALNGEIPSFEVINIPSGIMIAGAIHKLGKREYSEQVKKYIACVLFEEGWVIAPRNLSFCQRELDKLTCSDCKDLFKDYTADMLNKFKDFDDDDPISNNAVKIQAVELYLKDL